MLNSDFKVLPKEQALVYLSAQGLSLDDDEEDIGLESNSGLVFVLPNKEVLLYPLNGIDGYPSLIFSDMDKFIRYNSNSHFPIERKHMTYCEFYHYEILAITNSLWHHEARLSADLKIKLPLRSKAEINDAFEKLNLATNRSDLQRDTMFIDELENGLALSIIRYLIEFEGLTVEIDNRYETYNKAAYPVVLKDNKVIDVISSVKRANYLKSDNKFAMLSRWVGL
jgi:hypothetical protein